MEHNERRWFTRVPRQWMVELEGPKGTGGATRHQTRDLSLGGALLDGDRCYDVGARLSLSLGAQGGERLALTAMVMGSGLDQRGTRVRFVGLDTATRVKLLDRIFG
jgi:hypothetical protein